MAYSDFTITKVREAFALNIEEQVNLFVHVNLVTPSVYLQQALSENVSLATAVNTEKVRSELIIAPVLLEVRRIFFGKVGFFSGTEFNVNPGKGLAGFCDYILTASREEYEIRVPVLTLVEAKNENLKGGLGQCIAEMVAAQMFNEQNNSPIPSLYGAITSGTNWRFLKLEQSTVYIDPREYFINEVNLILGVLCSPFEHYFSSLLVSL